MDIAEMQDLIVDDRLRGVFRVNRRVFTDPEILEQERREIFDRSWLYAGHQSEIAKPGDFVTRRIGGRPLILVRDGDRYGTCVPQHLPASRQHRLPRARRLDPPLPLFLSRLGLRPRRKARRGAGRRRLHAGLRP